MAALKPWYWHVGDCGKIAFRSKRAAKAALKHAQSRPESWGERVVYRCRQCQGRPWHLSTNTTRTAAEKVAVITERRARRGR